MARIRSANKILCFSDDYAVIDKSAQPVQMYSYWRSSIMPVKLRALGPPATGSGTNVSMATAVLVTGSKARVVDDKKQVYSLFEGGSVCLNNTGGRPAVPSSHHYA